jgi:type II secretory pathway component PulF
MVYPIVIVVMMIGVVAIMMFFVMPKLMGMYTESGMELPLPTKIMVGIANFGASYWWLVLSLTIAGIISFRRFIATAKGRAIFDEVVINAPIIGKIVRLTIMTNFTRTFGLLTAAGISILESIKVVGDIVGNESYRRSFETSYQGVERGLTFSSQLMAIPIFPRIVSQMIKTGEETGKLDEVMFKVADYFESETDNMLKNVTTLIEPITLVILGIGVGLLVVSIILPIYQLTTNIK